jgi:ABC-type multidrug transport system fused ATPase/permease subunit
MAEPAKDRQPLSVHLRRLTRFTSAYWWMIRDAARGRRRLVLKVVALSVAAAGTQGLSVGILGFFAEQLADPEGVPEILAPFVPSSGVGLVALLAGTLFVALLGNSLFGWGAVRLGRTLGRSYHERVSRSVLEGFARSGPGAVASTRREVVLVIMRSGRLLGKAVESLLAAVPSVFRTGVAAAIVVATEPTLTLSVAPLLLILTPFVYRLGGRIRERSREFYDTAFHGMSGKVRDYVGELENFSLGAEAPSLKAGASFVQDPAVIRFLDLFDDLQLAVPRVDLVSSAFRSFMIVAVVGLAGYNIVQGGFSWGSLAVYVAALGFLLSSLQQLFQTVTKLNRQFPHLDRYMIFLKAANRSIDAGEPLPTRMELRIEAEGVPASSVSCEPGSVFYYAAPCRMSRLNAAEALTPLAVSSGTSAKTWSLLPFVINVPKLSEAANRETDTEAMLGAVMASGSPVALLGSELLGELTPARRRSLLEALSDRILLVVLGSEGVPELDRPVLVSDTTRITRITGLDDYVAQHKSQDNFEIDEEDDME